VSPRVKERIFGEKSGFPGFDRCGRLGVSQLVVTFLSDLKMSKSCDATRASSLLAFGGVLCRKGRSRCAEVYGYETSPYDEEIVAGISGVLLPRQRESMDNGNSGLDILEIVW
jgi:hypothetical protein